MSKMVTFLRDKTKKQHNCLNGCKVFERDECPVFNRQGDTTITVEDLVDLSYDYGAIVLTTCLVGCETYEG